MEQNKYIVNNIEIIFNEIETVEKSLKRKVDANSLKLQHLDKLMGETIDNFYNIIKNLQPNEKNSINYNYDEYQR